MKKIFPLLLLSIVLLNYAQAQGWCGTVVPESFKQVYASRDRSNYRALLSSRSGIQWVPVYYHIVTKDDGTGGTGLKVIFDSHCELNKVYNQFGIGFYIRGIDTVKSTAIWNYQSDLSGTAFNSFNQPNTCNVFVNGNLPGLCGFATLPFTSTNGGGIFLNKDCIGTGTTTFPHEMGHFFGLLHTFDTTFGVEFVNGTNCTTAGDLFCDTPADFIDFRTTCPYAGDQKDPNGDLYRTVLDPTLYMSYFNDNCVNRFSDMEKAEMVNALNHDRTSLLNQPMPSTAALDAVVPLHPSDGSEINPSNVQFSWNAITNATLYYFHLQSATSSLALADTIIADTVFTATNMQVGKKYKYFVKPLSYGNTCADNGDYQFIQTGTVRADVQVTRPSCSDKPNGVIAIHPLTGVPPYTFDWDDGSGDSVRNNLATGDYTVTITDGNGNSAVSEITLGAPPALGIHFTVNISNSLTAQATGGTTPYHYNWNNGTKGQTYGAVAPGQYQLTITDNNGCTTTQSFVYTAIGDEPETKAFLKVFPNPAYAASQLNIQLELTGNTSATISLLNLNGEVVQQINRSFTGGINTIPLDIRQIPSGIYLVKFQSGEGVSTQKVSLLR